MQRIAIVVAAVILAAVLVPPAAGQGTSGTMPEPIRTPELERYARRLGLGPQQRLAAQSYHDDYKREFRLLREGEIAEFLAEMQSLQTAGTFPSREKVSRIFTKMDGLNRKIRVLDDRFFDRLLPMLDEMQASALPRVRKARARKRFSVSGMSFSMSGVPVDLSDLTLDLDLDPETRAAIDPVLMIYEDRTPGPASATSSPSAQICWPLTQTCWIPLLWMTIRSAPAGRSKSRSVAPVPTVSGSKATRSAA